MDEQPLLTPPGKLQLQRHPLADPPCSGYGARSNQPGVGVLEFGVDQLDPPDTAAPQLGIQAVRDCFDLRQLWQG
jgi:hypothetical protein